MIFFCLVSRQAMANVLPVFMYKPEKVVLFTTPQEKHSADNLEKLFTLKGIKVQRKDNLDAYDYVKFKETVQQQLNNEADEVWLNVTGGTKLMALAAYEAFAEKNKKIIYCDTEHKKIIYLFPDYKQSFLQTNITIEEYLNAYGYTIEETKNIENEQDYLKLFSFIEDNNAISSFIELFKRVREYLSSENKSKQPKFTLTSKDNFFQFQKNYDKYFIHFGSHKKSSIKAGFVDFKSGDWLEFYVYYKLKITEKLSPLIGVKIKNQNGVQNEIDVIVLNDYRLYIYSCKTGKKDNQFDLYQLETLRNITSGTFGKGIFVTANKSSDKFVRRAEELEIKIINIFSTEKIEL